MTKLDDAILAHKRCSEAREQLDRLLAERDAAALAAFERRVPLRQLADVFGVTPGRVSQMLTRARKRAGKIDVLNHSITYP